jgi:hypothetical protein
MIPLFLTLTGINLACLAIAVTLGYVRAGPDVTASRHMLSGVAAAFVCCAVHCTVFTYFVATAKWAQHAVHVKRLDPALAAPTRSFRAQAFPAALAAIAVVFLSAFAGAGADNYPGTKWPAWHEALAIGSLAINVVAAAVEYRAIRRNGSLIDSILARVNADAPDHPGKAVAT